MKIYLLNGSGGSHSDNVKINVSLVGSVVLKGIEIYGIIQLLEGSHRMAHAVDLGLPITIVLFNDAEVIPHDCDDIESPTTELPDYATAGELARQLIIERGLLMYKVPIYESDDLPNVKIIKPDDETGNMIYSRLIKDSPFSAFPQKVWEIMFGDIKNMVDKNVLVINNSKAADAFEKLGAIVSFYDVALFHDLNFNNQFDLLYVTNIQSEADLINLFVSYKKLLNAEGFAVTINEKQTPEIISSVGLDVYGFHNIKTEGCTVSFVKMKKD